MNDKNEMENQGLAPQQPEAPSQPEAGKPGEPAEAEKSGGSAPQPAPEPQPQPEPAPTWEKPTPQLTLEPDPEIPAIEFTTEPPHAPEPPAPPQEPQPAGQQGEQQPTVQNQYVYNFNTQPTPGQDQGGSQGQPYAGYQPPNYTAQSYRPNPPQQPMYTTPPMGYQQKSRLAAGLLAFIFGVFGVHNFYMGFNGRGTIQLLLALVGGILTCGIGTVAAAIWGFIEAVMILSSTGPRFDGNGVIMKD